MILTKLQISYKEGTLNKLIFVNRGLQVVHGLTLYIAVTYCVWTKHALFTAYDFPHKTISYLSKDETYHDMIVGLHVDSLFL